MGAIGLDSGPSPDATTTTGFSRAELAANDPRGVVEGQLPQDAPDLGWATGYNLLAVPLAAGVLAWAGITLARRYNHCRWSSPPAHLCHVPG
jgi:hypothetical protein